MASLTIKDIPEEVLAKLRARAAADRRSMSKEGQHDSGHGFPRHLVRPGTRPSILHFGAIKARFEAAGQTLADAALFIASIALANGASVLTGNRRHYERIEGLRLEDWIQG